MRTQHVGLSQVLDYLTGFFFRRMFDGAGRAYSVTARTEHYAVVWVFHDGPFFSVFFFKFVRAQCAVVHAFTAADAFFVVYCGVPGDFVSGNSVPSFFRHLFVAFFYCIFVLYSYP